jgi:hypothetical protein
MMKIEVESSLEYRKKHAQFYDVILDLVQNQTAKINVNCVTKHAGYSRSSIRKDRDEWKPLLRDIELANNIQLQKPHFQVKVTLKKNKEINANVQEYKHKYLNILSAFYDLSRIVEDQTQQIKFLELQNNENLDKIAELNKEIDKLKSNGKVTHLAPTKRKQTNILPSKKT